MIRYRAINKFFGGAAELIINIAIIKTYYYDRFCLGKNFSVMLLR